MSDTPLDTLQISVTQTKDMAADAADLSVTVKGTSLMTGQMALNKAREVAQLVADLAGVGIGQENIFLQGVNADTASGAVFKTSGASYRLRIHVAPLEKLADALGVVTSQKNAVLNSISWRYPEEMVKQDEWLTNCIEKANAKAARIAAALGVRLLGVHQFTENYTDPHAEVMYLANVIGGTDEGARRRTRVSAEELGLDVTHTKTVTLQVNIRYRLSGFDDAVG